MKKVEKSKFILGIVLSVVIILTLASFNIVHADDNAWKSTEEENKNTSTNASTGSGTSDDDTFSNINWLTPETENTVNNTSNQVNNSSINETNVTFNVSNSSTNTINSTTSNSNSLAKTGITDSNGMFAVVLIVCGIVAIYSFKKINDYRNM